MCRFLVVSICCIVRDGRGRGQREGGVRGGGETGRQRGRQKDRQTSRHIQRDRQKDKQTLSKRRKCNVTGWSNLERGTGILLYLPSPLPLLSWVHCCFQFNVYCALKI